MFSGIAMTLSHSNPEEWAKRHKAMGLSAVVFPLDYRAPASQIDLYVNAAKEENLTIAEVGAWCNVLDADAVKREQSLNYCIRQLELAEYVKAACCVNITGTDEEVWDGSYASNYTPEIYEKTVLSIRRIIDAVNPKTTHYTVEPMPHMLPDSPETYLELIKDVNRSGFGVHLDVVNMITSPRVYFSNRELTERCFELLGDYICSCHVKDAILEHCLTVCIKEVPCGKGGFDIAYYLNKIEEKKLPFIVEHLSEEESYREAIHYINKICNKKKG